MSEPLIKALAEIVKIGEQACVKHRAAAEVASHATTCHHTNTERHEAGCSVCLKAALEKGLINERQNLVTAMNHAIAVEKERDRLRQALERIAASEDAGSFSQPWAGRLAREALGAKGGGQ